MSSSQKSDAKEASTSRRDSVDPALERRAELLERRFDGLLADVHLPFLEVRLYRKYYLSVRSEQRLNDLEKVLAAMKQHRTHTLAVLKLIHEREAVVKEITAKADEFAERKAATLDVQTRVLQLLHAHQEVTAKLIEAIQVWRSGLTRPYPFHWQGVNYIRKIVSDCEGIDECDLRTVLPLRLSQYPLCSNITSLALFANGDPGPNPTEIPHGSKGGKKATAEEKQKRARIVDAEKLIFDEAGLQAKVMRDLDAISASGYFVPLLNMPEIIPSCASGIRISNRTWSKQLSDAINDVAHDAVDDEALLEDDTDEEDEEALHDEAAADEGADADDGSKRPSAKSSQAASSRAPSAPSSRASSPASSSGAPPSSRSDSPRSEAADDNAEGKSAEEQPAAVADATATEDPEAQQTDDTKDTSQQLAASTASAKPDASVRSRKSRSKADARNDPNSVSRRTVSPTDATTSSRSGSTCVSTPTRTPSPVTSISRAAAREAADGGHADDTTTLNDSLLSPVASPTASPQK